MTSTWLLYVICALMLLAAIVAVLPTVLRAKKKKREYPNATE